MMLRVMYITMILPLTGCNSLFSENGAATGKSEPNHDTPGESSADVFRGTELSIEGIELVRIPAGSFTMGGAPKDVPREYSHCEQPAHQVTISQDFWMGRTEVTVGQFRKFVAETGFETETERAGPGCNGLNLKTGEVERNKETTWLSPGFPQTDRHPVVCVSWNDATAYCNWMTQKTG
ncbi:MAG: formylglycine-generating enzyme family protein, partial [Fuerstiella sp.]|nr:formylglycine-generating enzyme family protein [Fuerstiella sp.]